MLAARDARALQGLQNRRFGCLRSVGRPVGPPVASKRSLFQGVSAFNYRAIHQPVQKADYDVVIVGGGCVGTALSRALSKYHTRVLLLEKQHSVSQGTSKANSGICHAGIDIDLSTLKGRLVVPGNRMIHAAAKELHFGFKSVGELVVAQTDNDLKTLDKMWANGLEKGVPMERWNTEKIRKEEPFLSHHLKGAIYAPTAAVMNPYEFTFSLMDSAVINGVELRTDSEVNSLEKTNDSEYPLCVHTSAGDSYRAKFVLNCAGVYAEKVQNLLGLSDFRIVPRKGEEYLLDKNIPYKPKRVIFPTPTPITKGILLIPTVDGPLMVGPTATDTTDLTDVRTTPEGCKHVFDSVRKLCPDVAERDIIAYFAGLRPAVPPKNDYVIGPTSVKGFVNVAGIQSPGLTSAMSIAQYTIDEVLSKEGLKLEKKAKWEANVPKPPKFFSATTDEQRQLADVSRGPEAVPFTRIVCRCEMVTEGDVFAAIDAGAHSLDDLKFRTRAGCGRCQSGFCTTRSLQLLSQQLWVPIEELSKRGSGSRIIDGQEAFKRPGAREAEKTCVHRPKIPAERVAEMASVEWDVVVVGGGPAGLAAATGARREGAKRVLVLDREPNSGGILNQCIHSGFGLHSFKAELTGPEYSERWAVTARDSGAIFAPDTYIVHAESTGPRSKRMDVLVGGHGMIEVKAKSMVLAMGCRERTRPQIRIGGTRPAGVYTAGLAQKFINMTGKLPGKRIVILGSGDIGLIMARRLALCGAEVLGVFEVLPTCSGLIRNVVQCLHDYNIPLTLSHTVCSIHGNNRLERVTICPVGPPWEFKPDYSKKWDIDCDTLLLSVGLIPENELSGVLGVAIDPATRGPVVDSRLSSSVPGIFACGNVLHVHNLVDDVSNEAEYAGRQAAKHVFGKTFECTESFALEKGENVLYILPGKLHVPENDADEPAVISLRVTWAMRPGCLVVEREGCDKSLLTKRYSILLPSEMIRFKLPSKLLREQAAACNKEAKPLRLKVRIEGEKIPLEQLQRMVQPPEEARPLQKVEDGEAETKQYICLSCPNGCDLTLKHKGDKIEEITGYKCKRGINYATEEFSDPRRFFSMSIPIRNAYLPELPVKLTKPVPKKLLLEAAAVIRAMSVDTPVKMGDVLRKDLLGISGVNVIAARSLDRADRNERMSS